MRGRMFNCEWCKATNLIDERICYLESDRADVPFQIFNEHGQPTGKYNVVNCSKEECFDGIVSNIPSRQSDIPLWEFWVTSGLMNEGSGHGVCPVPFIEEEEDEGLGQFMFVKGFGNAYMQGRRALFQLVELEAVAKEYGVFPYGGGLMEQPSKLVEAFGVIRNTRNRYLAEQDRKLTKKMKKK